MTKYAIVNKRTREFYADPVYTNVEKGMDKIRYLESYRITHDMPLRKYELEALTKEREEQHAKEWDRFVSMLD